VAGASGSLAGATAAAGGAAGAGGEPQIEAAGGVLWRPVVDTIELAVVHRPRYDDWSIPKGKLEPGEHPLLGALRELHEETGFDAVAGRFVGEARYRHGGRPKRVRYWAMRATGGTFVSGDEVDELAWLPLPEAAKRVDTDADRRILDTFATDTRATTACVVARAPSVDLLEPAIVLAMQAFNPVRVLDAAVMAGTDVGGIVAHVRAGESVLCCAEPTEFSDIVAGLGRSLGGTQLIENSVAEGDFVVLHVAAGEPELVAVDSYPLG
jgi:8-oxo-dGTP pyrophosphatase MutT (NUDIX family)